MCASCGCSGHDIHPHHSHLSASRVVQVEQDILQENNLLAQRNRGFFEGRNILALNLMSSPGSGKTTLLERTLTDMAGLFDFSVIEGDLQTTHDAERIHATGTRVTQINTGRGCHLDAHMVHHALEGLKPTTNSVLFIENVGNLVCPALFDLGEQARVVVMSTTEGADKPIKYPDMFRTAQLCLINKADLLPYVPFDLASARSYLHQVNPDLPIIIVSALTGDGMERWYQWLREQFAVVEAEELNSDQN